MKIVTIAPGLPYSSVVQNDSDTFTVVCSSLIAIKPCILIQLNVFLLAYCNKFIIQHTIQLACQNITNENSFFHVCACCKITNESQENQSFCVSPTTIFANAVIRINENSFLHLCDVYLMMICMASNADRSKNMKKYVTVVQA